MKAWIILEVKMFIRRPAVRWMIVIWPTLLALAAWNTERDHRQIQAETDGLRAAETRHYEELVETALKVESGEITPDSLSWFQLPTNPLVAGLFRASGHYAIKDDRSTRWLAIGFADVQAPAYQVKMGRVMPPSSITLENPLNQALGRFDTAFLLVFLLPLFCITLAYDILSKDKQFGVMDLSAAYGQSKWMLLAIRGSIHSIFWMVLTMIPLLIAGALISTIEMAIWLPLMGALTIYVMIFLGLSLWVNRSSQAPLRNGLQLVTIWLIFLIFIPSLANAWLQSTYPPPQRPAEVASKRSAEVRSERDIVSPSATAGWHEYWLSEFQRRRLTDSLHAIDTERAHLVMERRTNISSRLEWLSPSLWFQSQVFHAAGVSARNYSDFRKNVHDFETRWTSHFMTPFLSDRLLTMDELTNRPSFESP